MTKHVLQIIEGAYRVTLEEQDDPAIWITHAMAGAGGKFSVLLKGNAVNYAVKAQDCSGLKLAGWTQTQPPKLAEEVAKLVTKGIDVYLVEEDASERGIERSEMIAGLKPVGRSGVAGLIAKHDQIWHW
jgi:hypothetical protein